MGTLLLIALLGTVLLLVYVSHPLRRRILREGFELPNFSMPSSDLSKNADFMTFFKFNQQVCTMWNEIMEDLMKNDQVSQPVAERLPKDQYIKQLAGASSFVKCLPFDAKSTLSVLLEAVPETGKVYKDTFLFLNTKISDSLQKVQSALDSTKVSVSAFADYEPFENCAAAVAAAVAATKAKPSPSVQELLAQQQKQTTQILTRISIILIELPDLQKGLQGVITKYNELKKYKKKAESGDIFNEVT